MVSIREAVFDDLDDIKVIFKFIFDQSIFAGMTYDESTIQRYFVMLSNYDLGYMKVVEDKGIIVGALAGTVTPNHFGIPCGVDMFNFSRKGTDLLIKDFVNWAKDHGAEFIQITDYTQKPRYEKLLARIGLVPVGTHYSIGR